MELIRSIATVHQGNSVFAGVGERTREGTQLYREMLESGVMKDTVMVYGQMNEPSGVRLRVALTALSMAEYFRDQGKNVLLIMDSVTRFAMAQREIGLAAGEPPTTRGYPPSVYAQLPKLIERAGRASRGSITAFYSVLVEGDDTSEPVSDIVRGLLDGHIILSRRLAAQAHYPAIDVLESISRLFTDIVPPGHQQAAQTIRELLEQSGFDPAVASRGLLTAIDTLERNTDEALRRMVFGAPSYVVGDEVFWGQDRLALLDAHLAAGA